jgi:SAM-dependent methyltransferase
MKIPGIKDLIGREIVMTKINLGSGGRPLEGYINVDVNPAAPGIDVVHDLNMYPWPFESDTADEIFADQCLEHLDDHNRAMKEIHRILKPGGRAVIKVPHFTWQLAYTDPTHKHFFGYHTFSYYARNSGYFDFKFSSCKTRLVFGKKHSFWNYLLEPLFNRFPNAYEQSPLRAFPALNVEAELVK